MVNQPLIILDLCRMLVHPRPRSSLGLVVTAIAVLGLICGFFSGVHAGPAQAQAYDASVLDLLRSNERFTTFASLLAEAHLENSVDGDRVTVLAPTNEAFTQMPSYKIAYLKNNTDNLRRLMSYFIITDTSLCLADLIALRNVTTLNGNPLRTKAPATIYDNTCSESTVVAPDLNATNGFIQGIDTVLIMPGAFCPGTFCLCPWARI